MVHHIRRTLLEAFPQRTQSLREWQHRQKKKGERTSKATDSCKNILKIQTLQTSWKKQGDPFMKVLVTHTTDLVSWRKLYVWLWWCSKQISKLHYQYVKFTRDRDRDREKGRWRGGREGERGKGREMKFELERISEKENFTRIKSKSVQRVKE